jgi:hypothetical protein
MCNYLSIEFNETPVRRIPPYHEQNILTLLSSKQYSPRKSVDEEKLFVLQDRAIQEC